MARINPSTPLGRELTAATARGADLQSQLESILDAVWREERAWDLNVRLEGVRIQDRPAGQ